MAKSISGPDQLRALFQKKLWILDMDGTVYLGDRVFPETLPFLERVRAAGANYLFFTNNASRSKQTYVKRLRDLGIPASEDQILTVTEEELKRSSPVFAKLDLKQLFRNINTAEDYRQISPDL